VTVEADLFHPDTRQVQVTADTVTPVEVLMEPLEEKVIKITGAKELVTPTQTGTQNNITQSFTQQFPVNVGNPISIQNVITTTPGLVEDSVNQVHSRGEHASTTVSID